MMLNRVIWMERRQMGKQRGGREVVLRRVIPGQPAKEHSQVFRAITGQTGGRIFSAEVPSSPIILACVKLTQR